MPLLVSRAVQGQLRVWREEIAHIYSVFSAPAMILSSFMLWPCSNLQKSSIDQTSSSQMNPMTPMNLPPPPNSYVLLLFILFLCLGYLFFFSLSDLPDLDCYDYSYFLLIFLFFEFLLGAPKYLTLITWCLKYFPMC